MSCSLSEREREKGREGEREERRERVLNSVSFTNIVWVTMNAYVHAWNAEVKLVPRQHEHVFCVCYMAAIVKF